MDDSFDMRLLKKEIDSVSESYIKVLLWNICGDTKAGFTKARKDIVPPIVESINPDVLLLQETCNRSLVKSIMKKLRSATSRDYRNAPRDVGETKVIYDANKYDCLLNAEKIFAQEEEKLSLNDMLWKAVEILTLAAESTEEEKSVYDILIRQCISVACFRKRDSPKSPVVIFISFHNHNQSESDVQARYVEELSELVSIIRELTRCEVLVGADCNQQLIYPCPCPSAYPYHTVLDYTPTRRLKSGQIDYFILDPPDFPVQQHDLLKLIECTTCSRLTDEQITYWKRVLNHDPLVCKIGVYHSKTRKL